jgi:glycosyltransferase involved in cell wall biosynthesis
MKISIITPSFNQLSFLKETMESIHSQVVDVEVEHIVMDGGSTDGTVEYLKSSGGQVVRGAGGQVVRWSGGQVVRGAGGQVVRGSGGQVIWWSGKDGGQADAVNKGIAKAIGDIIGWLNSDDLYLPGTLQAVADHFRQNPDCRWLYGRCTIIDKDGKERWKWITGYKNSRLKKFTYSKLLRENFISQPAVFFRKELFEEAGPLDLSLHYAMDYDLWLRFARISPACVINRELSSFRRHGTSKSETGFKDQFFEQYAVAVKNKPSLFNRAAHRFNIFKIITSYRILGLFSRF